MNNSKPYSKEFIQEKINAAKAGMGKMKVPVLYREQLSTGYSSLLIVGMGTKSLGEIRPQMFSVKSEGRGITKDTVKVTPDFGRKMDYVFGNATGNKHNIDRSIAMERQLNSIGIFDNKTGRKHVLDNLTDTFNDASSILKTQDNGRIKVRMEY
ncbi:hypothetical protein K6959_07100 [Bacillus aquiflavi]|uniref:hypothetical protein n=1 Tax=Bacillus aquiflavi TaxID=2672567 RepID=UPI001CA80BDC|nr:hypothetical protein [Bacillus aquiflavi]UAC49576.1 hypothetical protein K6959_07100 [Bacillus aquiflavi]